MLPSHRRLLQRLGLAAMVACVLLRFWPIAEGDHPTATLIHPTFLVTEPSTSLVRPTLPLESEVPPSSRAPPFAVLNRVLTMNPLLPWYGITNQLMCYAAALRYGIDDHRAVLFPTDKRVANVIPFYTLIDVTATQQRLGDVVTIAQPSPEDYEFGYGTRAPASSASTTSSALMVPASWYPPTSMNKKKLHLPERTVYRSRDANALRAPRAYLVNKVYPRSREYAFVRHHNFFMRFAWPMRTDRTARYPQLDECRLMAVFEPTSVIRRYADGLKDRLGKYVAIHLRIEPDAQLLRQQGARAPSPAQFSVFLATVAFPIASRHGAKVVYLCTGRLPEELQAVVQQWNAANASRLYVAYRALVVDLATRLDGTPVTQSLPALPKFEGAQRDVHKSVASRTQDHYASFVELLVLTHAAAAAVTEYSSLKFAVYSRRCSGYGLDQASARGDDEGVYTISIAASGFITTPQRHACAEAATLGWCGPLAWGEN